MTRRTEQLICEAIERRRLIAFHYEGTVPGRRMVEPHILGYAANGHLLLSGWQRRGGSGEDWRDFLVAEMHGLTLSEERFQGPRPGYNPADRTFAKIVCAL